jgi:hypothetical protein
LPTYYHSARPVNALPRTADPSQGNPDNRTFSGLRVPHGLNVRRSYEMLDGLPKHHIYYLNYPGSPFHVNDPAWR